ncbi:DUF1810 domain-containing protein [Paraflavisolibacter sp. H34]|uniref:DUF1810 domain-containing protein n=1 Tax=Huijunlia imazamoxiresistens TaxID=3127457 RepID=UPI003015FECF
MSENNLQRFLDAQDKRYAIALEEVKSGRKRSHWMWYVFPQIQGLSLSETSKYYAIKDSSEAAAYLDHPLLASRLEEMSNALLQLPGSDAHAILGSPDDQKLRSSMTLFSTVPGASPVFVAVLEKFYGGEKDHKTLELLQRQH